MEPSIKQVIHYGIIHDSLSERAIEVLLKQECHVALVNSLDIVPECGIVYLGGQEFVQKWPSRFIRHVILRHKNVLLLGVALRDNHYKHGNFDQAVVNAARAAEACLAPEGLPNKVRKLSNPWLAKTKERDLVDQLRAKLSVQENTLGHTPKLWPVTEKSSVNWRSLHRDKVHARLQSGFTY